MERLNTTIWGSIEPQVETFFRKKVESFLIRVEKERLG